MKTIWTLLFLALIATTFGIVLMFVPESARTERFWLTIGAIGFAEFMLWIAFTFRASRRGEQAGGFAGVTMIMSTLTYLLATIALGLLSFAPLGFKVLLALHIIALLVFAFVAGIGAIATRTLQGTGEATRPRV
jgi:hypothetical protein